MINPVPKPPKKKKHKSGEIPDSVKQEVLERSNGLCEICGKKGDFRGLSWSHDINRGMGGTRRIYTANEVSLLCYPCHSNERHHLREK